MLITVGLLRVNQLFFQLSKLTVPVLKDFVKQAGIKCGTKKADLIEAIKDHFGV